MQKSFEAKKKNCNHYISNFKHYISSSFKSFEMEKKWFAFGDIFFALALVEPSPSSFHQHTAQATLPITGKWEGSQKKWEGLQ